MINGKHPFLDMDIGKMLAAFSLPGLDFGSLVAAHRKNLEALRQANELVLEGLQTLAQRQLELVRLAVEEAPAALSGWAHPGAPDEQMAQHVDLAKQAFEKAIVQARELAELVGKANAEAFEVLQKRMAESFEEVRDLTKSRRPA
jgi:phasin family protein